MTYALFDDAGALTADEQLLVGHARAFGNYAGTLPSSDDGSEEVIAEDVSIHLHASTGSFSHGSTTTWTLLVESSEYALRTGPIVITQVIPDGLEFVRSTTPLDAEYPVSNADGSLTVRWTLPGFTAPSSVAQISFDTTTRWKYRATKTPVAATDGWTSTVELSTVSDVVTAADGTTTTLPIGDTSLARQRSAGPRITKDVAAPLPGTTCGDGSALTFAMKSESKLGYVPQANIKSCQMAIPSMSHRS